MTGLCVGDPYRPLISLGHRGLPPGHRPRVDEHGILARAGRDFEEAIAQGKDRLQKKVPADLDAHVVSLRSPTEFEAHAMCQSQPNVPPVRQP